MTARGERLAPPVTEIGVLGWLRRNLFSSWLNSLLTAIVAVLLALVLVGVIDWAVNHARWGVVTQNLRLFLAGRYPPDELWRVWLSMALLSVLAGVSAAVLGSTVRTLANWLAASQLLIAGLTLVSGMGLVTTGALLANAVLLWVAFAIGLRIEISRRWLGLAWLLSLPVSWLILAGQAGLPLEQVRPDLWGGLLLTFMLAIIGIALSFPFGVLLALGRRSEMPAVRVLSTVYIEVVRGVPLVTILFMAAIMLPLFLGGLTIDRVVRAMGGIILFSAAYVAENVRGGLQAIPSGQVEAAHAVGLNTIQTNLYIVLPQALRSVIPANVGLFISLLKDTTLVTIVGLFELLGIGRAVLAQTEWFGAHVEVYVFISLVFFVLCYTMSQASYRLEAAMGVGKR